MSKETMKVMGAIFNLNDPAHVVHWHFFQMSVSNVVVIGLMLIVFALAILMPFPGAARRQEARTLKGTLHDGGQAGEQAGKP